MNPVWAVVIPILILAAFDLAALRWGADLPAANVLARLVIVGSR